LGVEEYEEYEGRGSPQAPRALLRPLLRSPLGIPGVKGRQEFGGTNPWPLGVEEYEEYEGRGSPQAPRALLRPLLRSPFGIPGVKGRQELGKFKSKKKLDSKWSLGARNVRSTEKWLSFRNAARAVYSPPLLTEKQQKYKNTDFSIFLLCFMCFHMFSYVVIVFLLRSFDVQYLLLIFIAFKSCSLGFDWFFLFD